MATLRDDLGHPVQLSGPARRVVSLVPSLTEAIAVTTPERLVGATDWCTHPADLDVRRVRGTKNPDRAAIEALRPDLVVVNQEENRRLDVERLRAAGVNVWVTVIESVPQALASMRRLFTEPFGTDPPDWLLAAERSGPCPPRLPDGGSSCRSGVTRGWSSGPGRSPVICWRGWAWTTPSPTAQGAIRRWASRTFTAAGPTWWCCRTSPTSSPPPTGPRPFRDPRGARLRPLADLVRAVVGPGAIRTARLDRLSRPLSAPVRRAG